MLEYAVTYLRISCVGLPFVLITYVGHGVMRGVNDLRKPLQIVLIANVVNLVLEDRRRLLARPRRGRLGMEHRDRASGRGDDVPAGAATTSRRRPAQSAS